MYWVASNSPWTPSPHSVVRTPRARCARLSGTGFRNHPPALNQRTLEGLLTLFSGLRALSEPTLEETELNIFVTSYCLSGREEIVCSLS